MALVQAAPSRREIVSEPAPPFSSLRAPERASALADPDTLAPLDAERPARGALWAGRARIGGRDVYLALTDGRQKGGTLGVEEAGLLSRIVAAAQSSRTPLALFWDTGGVRVPEGALALAATAAAGVAVARAALSIPVFSVVSGPRGCFGAPGAIAATATTSIMTANSRWGLTGPILLAGEPGSEEASEGTSAQHRHRCAHAEALVPDSPAAIRVALARLLARPFRRTSLPAALQRAVFRTEKALRQIEREERGAPHARRVPPQPERDLFRYSFRGHWQATGPTLRGGLVHAAWGQLDGEPALGIAVGPEDPARSGMGIREANAIAKMVRFAANQKGPQRAPILLFVFCQGHASSLLEERAGIPVALAECMRSLVLARAAGHPTLCVLGGGVYGAAYVALAAPCHRILALRGTAVAPMAPRLLATFRRLRSLRLDPETPADLGELLPEVRMVESAVRLPRALRAELDAARERAAPNDWLQH